MYFLVLWKGFLAIDINEHILPIPVPLKMFAKYSVMLLERHYLLNAISSF